MLADEALSLSENWTRLLVRRTGLVSLMEF